MIKYLMGHKADKYTCCLSAQKQCVCGGSEFAINILKKIGLISEKSRAVPKLESKVYIIVI